MRYSLQTITFSIFIIFGLNISKAETVKIELNSGALRLRQSPTAESESCGSVANGSNVTLISSSNGWYQVQTNNPSCPTAWVHSYFTSEYYNGQQSTDFLNNWNPTPTRIEVGEGQLRLRNSPRSNSSTCGTIDNGTQVERLVEDDGWFLIRTNNRNCPTAWIHGYYTQGQYQGPQSDSYLRSWRPSEVAQESAADVAPRVTISTSNYTGPPITDDSDPSADTVTIEDAPEVATIAPQNTIPVQTPTPGSPLSAAEEAFYHVPSSGEFRLDPSQMTEAGYCSDCLNRENMIPENFPILGAALSGIDQPIGWNITDSDRRLGARCVAQKEAIENMPRPNFPNLNAAKISAIESNLFDSYGVNPEAFRRTLAYYRENSDTIRNARYMTIVDMSQPAENHRKFLIDLETGNIEAYYVSHGRGSDRNQTGRVQNFGNVNNSNKTPSGFLLTGQIYNGKYGASLALHGQEEGVNDESCRRAIVIHRAMGNGGIAASDASTGNRWRSNGCFAMNRNETQSYIERTQNGSVYYVYDGN